MTKGLGRWSMESSWHDSDGTFLIWNGEIVKQIVSILKQNNVFNPSLLFRLFQPFFKKLGFLVWYDSL